jgi:Flp pilus assembly protein TadG
MTSVVWTSGASGRRRVSRRGATLIFFMLVMIPFSFFSLAMAADLTRVVDANRQASYVAINSAIAGSIQYQPRVAALATGAATTAARDTATTSFTNNVMRHAKEPQATVSIVSSGGRPRQVQVTVRYKIRQLLILQYFVGGNDAVFSVTRRAEICQSGASPTTAGFCSRPRLR